MTSSPSSATRRSASRRLWSRRIRALLASGLVLGVGSTVTLAAWNDSEYVSGSVTSGQFGLEGSVDGSSYRSSDPESPHTLSFSPDTQLFPGSTDYALFSVRTAAESLGGTVQVLADDGNAEGLGAYLTYGIRQIEGATCNAESFNSGEVIVERGSSLTTGAESAEELAANQGTVVNYCLELSLPVDADNAAQGLTATPSWEFLGISVSG